MKTKRKFKTSTIHLYHNPCSKNGKGDCNIFIDGETMELEALLITAARVNENFYNALFSAASFIIRDETE